MTRRAHGAADLSRRDRVVREDRDSRPCEEWQGIDDHPDGDCPRCGWAQAEHEARPFWRITVDVPLDLPVSARHLLFGAVCRAVGAWEPAERDGWDADVSGLPVAECCSDRRHGVMRRGTPAERVAFAAAWAEVHPESRLAQCTHRLADGEDRVRCESPAGHGQVVDVHGDTWDHAAPTVGTWWIEPAIDRAHALARAVLDELPSDADADAYGSELADLVARIRETVQEMTRDDK